MVGRASRRYTSPARHMTHTLESSGPDQTAALAASLATCLQPGDLVGMIGDLGAGKTLFVQGLAHGLAVPPSVRVTSPTFTLINEYHGGRLPVYHADLYRLVNEAELDELGLDELCRRGDGVVVVEWVDRFAVLPADHLLVEIEVRGASERGLRCSAHGPRSRALLDAWLAHL